MTKKERVLAVMNGEAVDKIPAGFWFHYKPEYTPQEMIDAHIELFRETDMDIIKIMQDYSYPVEGKITCADDWYHISVKGTDSEEFAKMTEVIRGIREKAGDDVLIFQTMFGPFKAASIAFGDDVLMKYSKEAPEAVVAGVQIIADALEEWAKGYLEAGADGIYYSAQFGEIGRFETEEWEKLVKPSDLQILNVAQEQEGKYNILHICGEPEYEFKTWVDRFTSYPADLVNWSVKDNHYSLEKGRDAFGKPILGGMNNKGNILNGPAEEIEKEVIQILDHFGTKGIMIGADCTIQGKNIRTDYIKVAVDAAHNYKNGRV
ncbi:MAG: uroporphyrinogen decarboxylase family protein [Eubacteriales bacterium]|nr:uroporphyrinogen decarboxylase family protein [Eubacteriales bacterium]